MIFKGVKSAKKMDGDTMTSSDEVPERRKSKRRKRNKEEESDDDAAGEGGSQDFEDSSKSQRKKSKHKKRKREHLDESEAMEAPSGSNEDAPRISKSGKPLLFGDEYLKLKQRLKERKKLLKKIPRFSLQNVGLQADILQGEFSIDIRPSDVRNLLLYSLIGNSVHCHPSRWCNLERPKNIVQTAAVVVDGVGCVEYADHKRCCFELWDDEFPHQVQIGSECDSKCNIDNDFSVQPVSKKYQKLLVKECGSMDAALESNKVFVYSEREKSMELRPMRTDLLLSLNQMAGEGYPLSGNVLAGFKATKKKYKEVTPDSPMFSLDCEMCQTEVGLNEVTRVGIVDENLDEVYDTLVKPYNRITNYLTKFSGITPAMMRGVTMRLEDVQRDLSKLLPPDAILVGQSLNFDLMALHMIHPYVIDTSVIYNVTGHPKRKTKLATLSSLFLDEKIQQSESGHCPVEDSKAAMKLVLRKLEEERSYGDMTLGGFVPSFRMLNDGEIPSGPEVVYGASTLNQVNSCGKTVEVIGTKSLLKPYTRYDAPEEFSSHECEFTEVTDWKDCKKRLKSKFSKDYTVVLSDTTDMMKKYGTVTCRMMKKIKRMCDKVKAKMSKNSLLVVFFTGKNTSQPVMSKNGVCLIKIC